MSFIDWVKTHKVKSFLVFLVVLLAPLIIVHILFKWNSGFDFIAAEWTAGDLIGYIAGFEAFAGALTLGIIAVWQTEKANNTNDNLLKLTEDNEIKSVLPFLSFNAYLTKYEGENFISLLAKSMPDSKETDDEAELIKLEDNSKRMDVLFSEIIFTISHDNIEVRSELTKEQQEKIKSQFGINKHTSGISFTDPDYKYTKVYVENCGKGSAINVKSRLFKKEHEETKEFDVYTVPFTVPIGRHFDLGLFFDLCKEIEAIYIIEFFYQDIYMNKYKQSILINVDDNTCVLDLYQPQIQL